MAILSKEEVKEELDKLTRKVSKVKTPHCSLCGHFVREVKIRGVEDVIDNWGGDICQSDDGIMREAYDRYHEITIDLQDCEECNGKGFIELKDEVASTTGMKNNDGVIPYIVCSSCKGWQKLDWIERATEIKHRYRYSPDVIYGKKIDGRMIPVMRYEKIS